MAEEVPKPLVYSAEGQLTSGNEGSITYTHRHPSHNLLAVGDTSGHIKMSVTHSADSTIANSGLLAPHFVKSQAEDPLPFLQV